MKEGSLVGIVNQIMSEDFAEIEAQDGIRQFVKRVKNIDYIITINLLSGIFSIGGCWIKVNTPVNESLPLPVAIRSCEVQRNWISLMEKYIYDNLIMIN